jgi:hypothetical protein
MRIERRRLAAVLMAAGVLLLGHAAELAAQTRVPWWRKVILPNPRIDTTSSYTQSRVPFSIDLSLVDEAAGSWFTEATAYADFNGDGTTDVLAMPIAFDFSPQPPIVLTGLDQPALTDITADVLEGDMPRLVRAYRALVADFNRDGRPDVYFASANPFEPETNALLLSTRAGKLRWATELVEPPGFRGASSAADIDNDGDVDVFASNPNYFLINDGRGRFAIDAGRLPAGLGDSPIVAAELVDVDRDGYIDLVVGGHEFEGRATAIYWGGPLGLRNAAVTVLPAVPGFGIVVDIEVDDLDGDGRREVLLTRTKEDPFYQGYSFQILRQTRRRVFADESLARIIGDPATWPGSQPFAQVIVRVRTVDIDGDGSRDIVPDNKGRGLGWVNDGRGYFTFRSPW